MAYALLSNSEFVIMLRQTKSLEALERLYGLSQPEQTSFSIPIRAGNTNINSINGCSERKAFGRA